MKVLDINNKRSKLILSMKLAALISGGKDSMLALHKAAENDEIACLVGVIPENPESYMYHTPNLHLLDAIAKCLDLPLHKVTTAGEEEKEVDDLIEGLENLDVDGLVIGGVESEYQKKRFERVCSALNIKMIAPLWHVDVLEMMKEVVEKFDCVIVKVSAMGLTEDWLGRKIDLECLKDLMELNKKYGIHLAGEGGEYETLVLDAPLYKKRIVVEDFDVNWKNYNGVFEIKRFRLEDKV